MLENSRKFKNSPNLLLLFVKITKFLEFSKKITIKTIVFSNSERSPIRVANRRKRGGTESRGAQERNCQSTGRELGKR